MYMYMYIVFLVIGLSQNALDTVLTLNVQYLYTCMYIVHVHRVPTFIIGILILYNGLTLIVINMTLTHILLFETSLTI